MDVALSQYEAEGTRPAWQAVDGPDEWAVWQHAPTLLMRLVRRRFGPARNKEERRKRCASTTQVEMADTASARPRSLSPPACPKHRQRTDVRTGAAFRGLVRQSAGAILRVPRRATDVDGHQVLGLLYVLDLMIW